MDKKNATELLPVRKTQAELPPILVGRHTPAVEAQVGSFYGSVAEIFERWVTRRASTHTQRAYRQDVMDFVQFLGIGWPDESTRLFTVSIAEVQAFRDQMVAESKAPKTINRRIASLSPFYKYLQGVASEFRLPITVPNPAHAQFIARGSSDPRDETRALSATCARQLKRPLSRGPSQPGPDRSGVDPELERSVHRDRSPEGYDGTTPGTARPHTTPYPFSYLGLSLNSYEPSKGVRNVSI